MVVWHEGIHLHTYAIYMVCVTHIQTHSNREGASERKITPLNFRKFMFLILYNGGGSRVLDFVDLSMPSLILLR